MRTCRLCDGEISESFMVKEMLIGLRETFEYLLCSSCGCLQIAAVPSNLSKYYPQDYYSLQTPKRKKSRIIRDYIRSSVALYNIQGTGWVGCLLTRFKSPDIIHAAYRRVGLKFTDKILDVGGGSGAHALSLHSIGFKDAMSVDPFISKNIYLNGKIIAKKAQFFDIQESYDLITFHHSLEHMPSQEKILEKAAEIINPGGQILIRIPTVTSTAWENYGVDWVNLDAPRHLYLHSHSSIKMLAKRAGLKVIDFWNDSVSMQFWGSEQYKKNIPLTDPRSYSQDKTTSIFSSEQIIKYQREADILNQEGKGDWICIILGK